MKAKIALVLEAVVPELFGAVVWALAIGFAFNLNFWQAVVAGVLTVEVMYGLDNINKSVKALK